MQTIKINCWREKPENYTGIVEYSDGIIYYYLNGKKHREDGPAVIFDYTEDDYYLEEYYLNDVNITEEVNKIIKDNIIPKDYRIWDDNHKLLFKLIFSRCFNILKIDSWKDLPKNYTGIVKNGIDKTDNCSINHFLNGQYHRENGPAIVWDDGSQEYYLNGKQHCDNGPAYIWDEFHQKYYLNGFLHRTDGPAIHWDSDDEYFINGIDITKEVEQWIKENGNNLPEYWFEWEENHIELFKTKFTYYINILEVNYRQKLPVNYTGITKFKDNTIRIFLNGKLHREDGPAIICHSGTLFYFKKDKRHREDGPAIIWADGTMKYYLNDKLHREDGPAIIRKNGKNEYYLNGKKLKWFKRWLKSNNIPDYEKWNNSHKLLFKLTFG